MMVSSPTRTVCLLPSTVKREGRLFEDLERLLVALFNDTRKKLGRPLGRDEYGIDKPGYRAAADRETGWANANLRSQLLKNLDRAKVAHGRDCFIACEPVAKLSWKNNFLCIDSRTHRRSPLIFGRRAAFRRRRSCGFSRIGVYSRCQERE